MSEEVANTEADYGFAAPDDGPIAYLARIRDYYLTLGFGAPYRWAQYTDVPFQALPKPLSQSTVAIVTTAAPYQPDKGDQGPGAPYNASAKFYRVYDAPTALIRTCGSRISAMTANTPRLPIKTPGSRYRRCAARWRQDESAALPHVSSVRRPTARNASR